MKIKYINNIWCRADLEATKIIAPHLIYDVEVWTHGPFSKTKKVKQAYFINRNTGVFLAGILPRVLKLGKFEVEGSPKSIFYGINEPYKNPHFDLRDYQYDLNKCCLNKGRGVLSALTSAGKTIMAASILTTMVHHKPNSFFLFLCHTRTLLNQTYAEFTKFGLNCSRVGDGHQFYLNKDEPIVISTIQSFSNLLPEQYKNVFDLVIIDEVHRVNKLKSRYGEVLLNLQCWNRLGLTATVPKEKAKLLALEGLVGPVIGTYALKQGIDDKNAVKPRITLLPVDRHASIADLTIYNKIYTAGITNNLSRNRSIVDACKERNDKGKTVLVMIKAIEHGQNILNIAKENKVGRIIFIQGKSLSSLKEAVKEAFQNKNIKTVICTNIWREGINIPSLDCVIDAGSGKSEQATLQAIGRGLRTFEGKTELEIIDFLDPYKYLAEHAMIRFNIYAKEGWL